MFVKIKNKWIEKRRIRLAAIILVIIAILVVGFLIWISRGRIQKPLSSCEKLEDRIKSSIEEANYCKTDSDCLMAIDGRCPQGCYNFFNKNADLAKMRDYIKEYDNSGCHCAYDCSMHPKQEEVICKNNKCIDSRLGQ